MFNLLFVDDDALILESVREMLDWKRLSINTPFIAFSYNQALEIFNRERIDIMVSDIEMLGHSGIDLAEWVRLNHPQTLCCFLTCHARFEYARRAVSIGAQGYMLKPIDAVELEEFLSQCVKQLSRLDKVAASNRQIELSSLVQSAVSYIERNYSNAISRETLSRELCVSESKLSRVFNNETGMTITEFINECRMKRAEELLVSTDLSITEICTCVGYNYPAYFTKMFRERTGKTPFQYRS